MNIKQIGSNILFYLNEQDKTQVELAEAVGSSKQVINKIIKGTKALKIQELVAISDFLKVKLEDIINDNKIVKEKELEAVHLSGSIRKPETASFILSIINNLSTMEEELDAHGLLK